MPTWIKDETIWKQAKIAAAESMGKSIDQLGEGDWALITNTYQQMTKSTTLDTVKDFLQKARRRLSDENPDYSDVDDEQDNDGLDSEISDEPDDDADKWLKTHEKDAAAPEQDKSPEYDEYQSDENPETHQAEAQKPTAEEPVSAKAVAPIKRSAGSSAPVRENTPEYSEDDLQPSKEELAQMREYTRPWEQNARDRAKLEADPSVNPVSHHQGRLVEARNTSHADRQKAYGEFTQSPEYKAASPVAKMRLEAKFQKDWKQQNPEHLKNALIAHNEAHKKGSEAMNTFKQVKDEKIRHIAGGGAQPGSMSAEEAMQHVGGSRDDEDSGPSGIQQDKGAAFASGNQEFMQQYMKNYDKKSKKYSNVDDMDNLDPEVRADVNSVLGEHPALKDPTKKRQVDRFVSKYHPLIGKAARQVLSKLGLTEKANRGEIDAGLLHEAGVHALFQATNDYDHDHPSKAKFTTHLNRKMHGLMQTALKTQDEIPADLRAGAKNFDTQRRNQNAAPVKHTNKEGVTTIIQPGGAKPAAPAPTPARSLTEIAPGHHEPDVHDRFKRVTAARAPLVRKQTALQPKPAGPRINNIMSSEDGEE